MAFDAFLKLDGIKGEATDKDHKDEIVIQSYSFSVSQTGSGVGTAGGHAGGKASFGDLAIMKSLDAASPNLYVACAKGTIMKTGVMTVRRAGGDNPVEYLKIELEDVMITSIAPSGSASDVPFESVSLAYGKIKWTYKQQDPTTGGASGDVAAGWDLKTNKPV